MFKSPSGRQLDLFLLVPNLNPRPRFSLNSQMVYLRSVGILKVSVNENFSTLFDFDFSDFWHE